MLLFRSEEDKEAWCAVSGAPGGDVLTFEKVWELSKLWYGDRLSPGFNGRTVAEAHQIFQQLGLKPPFWQFEGT